IAIDVNISNVLKSTAIRSIATNVSSATPIPVRKDVFFKTDIAVLEKEGKLILKPIGTITYLIVCHLLSPSELAASMKEFGTASIPPLKFSVAYTPPHNDKAIHPVNTGDTVTPKLGKPK